MVKEVSPLNNLERGSILVWVPYILKSTRFCISILNIPFNLTKYSSVFYDILSIKNMTVGTVSLPSQNRFMICVVNAEKTANRYQIHVFKDAYLKRIEKSKEKVVRLLRQHTH